MGEEARACAGVATLAASVEDETVGKNAAATRSRRVRARAGRRVADGVLGERRRKTHVVDVVADAGAESGRLRTTEGTLEKPRWGVITSFRPTGRIAAKYWGWVRVRVGTTRSQARASSRAMIVWRRFWGSTRQGSRSEETRAFQNGRRDDESGRRRDGGERSDVASLHLPLASRASSHRKFRTQPRNRSRAPSALLKLFDMMLE